ncbi:unnamed protein product [Linum trigynum]|uniref:Uncharacterized protein n=1 Tax=Linum trigynum TaxID=586398 RepID=A0AAV2E2W0_9ROSI
MESGEPPVSDKRHLMIGGERDLRKFTRKDGKNTKSGKLRGSFYDAVVRGFVRGPRPRRRNRKRTVSTRMKESVD